MFEFYHDLYTGQHEKSWLRKKHLSPSTKDFVIGNFTAYICTMFDKLKKKISSSQ